MTKDSRKKLQDIGILDENGNLSPHYQRGQVRPSDHKLPIFYAADNKSIEESLDLVDSIKDLIHGVKLGLEFFTRYGPSGVEEFQGFGLPIFLDMKYHDIPNTVKNAVAAAAELEVEYLTIHLSGHWRMVQAAIEAAGKTEIIGVTVLTSIAETSSVESLARKGYNLGIRNFVCSVKEIQRLKSILPDIKLFVPGIRVEPSDDDQKRVGTPREALNLGADFLVMGRAILNSPDPRKLIYEIQN